MEKTFDLHKQRADFYCPFMQRNYRNYYMRDAYKAARKGRVQRSMVLAQRAQLYFPLNTRQAALLNVINTANFNGNLPDDIRVHGVAKAQQPEVETSDQYHTRVCAAMRSGWRS